MSTRTLQNATISGMLDGFARELGRALTSIAAGQRAAREYHEMSSRSDAALAREGLRREDIAETVCRRNFG